MNKKPFLTIGIASYNYADYLLKAFEQIKKQTFTDYELLYCDDGSTDDSVPVIEKIIRDNPDMQIRLVKGENKGVLANRNRILEQAEGEYLLICDADDYMADNCLELLCGQAIEQSADCVIGGFSELDGNGKEYKLHIPQYDSNKWIYIWHHAQIYRMQIIREHNLRFDCIPDDVCFLQRVHQHAERVSFVSEKVYYWCRHKDSTSGDVERNADWHPNNLWKNIVDCTLNIQKDVQESAELWAIRYFLYKWFYFNVTDLPVHNSMGLGDQIRVLQMDMKRICPEYRKLFFLKRVLKEKDTIFAKTAIVVCWILEGFGCIRVLPIIRSVQRNMHK